MPWIATLNLEYSGEHYGTFFLTSLGIIDQGGEKVCPVESKHLSDMYSPLTDKALYRYGLKMCPYLFIFQRTSVITISHL